jgi:PAS domain S-box-containing protein
MEIESRYGKLINYLTDYIYTVKIKDGAVIDTNHGPGCISVTGYTSDDYKKNPSLWYNMVPQKDRHKVLEQARLALAGEEAGPLEHRIIHRDGTTRWIPNNIIVTKNADGKPVAYDGLINDITPLKRAQAAEAVKNRQLIQADKMASLGILVSGIAHEINNPNNFILLNIQLFSKIWKDAAPILDAYRAENGDFSLAGISYGSLKEKIAQSLEGILIGSERIQNITKRLTDYAKMDSGQLNEEVDLNKVVSIAIVIANTLIKKSTTNFSVDYGKGIPTIRGNAQQLEQVVITLLNNACQALRTASDGIFVQTYYDPQRSKVGIKVHDQGVGIKAEDQARSSR